MRKRRRCARRSSHCSLRKSVACRVRRLSSCRNPNKSQVRVDGRTDATFGGKTALSHGKISWQSFLVLFPSSLAFCITDVICHVSCQQAAHLPSLDNFWRHIPILLRPLHLPDSVRLTHKYDDQELSSVGHTACRSSFGPAAGQALLDHGRSAWVPLLSTGLDLGVFETAQACRSRWPPESSLWSAGLILKWCLGSQHFFKFRTRSRSSGCSCPGALSNICRRVRGGDDCPKSKPQPQAKELAEACAKSSGCAQPRRAKCQRKQRDPDCLLRTRFRS